MEFSVKQEKQAFSFQSGCNKGEIAEQREMTVQRKMTEQRDIVTYRS